MTEGGHVRIDLRLAGADQACAILIGSNLLDECVTLLKQCVKGRRLAVVCDAAIAQSHGGPLIILLTSAGFDCVLVPIHATEANKTLETAARLYSEFLKSGLDRTSAVVAVGGGIVTDLAGFAAATFMRGITLINIPTTLLGMVDAAIGGKTGVNFPLPDAETLGKNLVGAFHHPAAVLMDVNTLATLPPRAFRCGLAECIKHAIIADPGLLDWIESNADSLDPGHCGEHVEFIARNVRIKAEVVASDERESSQRLMLNLGHTFAHAIETRPELALEHGEAVALGLLAACAAGEHLKLTTGDLRPRLRGLMGQLGLPVRMKSAPPLAEIISAMKSDKKTRAGSIRLLIPIDAGVVEIVDPAPDSAVEAGMNAIAP